MSGRAVPDHCFFRCHPQPHAHRRPRPQPRSNPIPCPSWEPAPSYRPTCSKPQPAVRRCCPCRPAILSPCEHRIRRQFLACHSSGMRSHSAAAQRGRVKRPDRTPEAYLRRHQRKDRHAGAGKRRPRWYPSSYYVKIVVRQIEHGSRGSPNGDDVGDRRERTISE